MLINILPVYVTPITQTMPFVQVLASYDEEEDAHRYTMTLWLTTEDPGTIQPPAPSVTEKEGKEQ